MTVACERRPEVYLESSAASSARSAPGLQAQRGRRCRGFTLLELIIVIAVIGILAAVALPRMLHTPQRAAEATLKTNLRAMRDAIDQHYADKGHYPSALEALVDGGYLRRVPSDPVTKSAETWMVIYEELDFDYDYRPAETDLPDDGMPGIIDVRSGAEGTTLDGVPYGEL